MGLLCTLPWVTGEMHPLTIVEASDSPSGT